MPSKDAAVKTATGSHCIQSILAIYKSVSVSADDAQKMNLECLYWIQQNPQ